MQDGLSRVVQGLWQSLGSRVGRAWVGHCHWYAGPVKCQLLHCPSELRDAGMSVHGPSGGPRVVNRCDFRQDSAPWTQELTRIQAPLGSLDGG